MCYLCILCFLFLFVFNSLMKQKSPSLVKSRAHHLQCESVANKEQQNEWEGRAEEDEKKTKRINLLGREEDKKMKNEKRKTLDRLRF
jgi:hypothetical protein